jgi:ribonuclease D
VNRSRCASQRGVFCDEALASRQRSCFNSGVRIVASVEELQAALARIEGQSTFYIDTEFDSSKQGKTLSLIQISCGGEIYVVDALRLPSLAPLAPALFAPEACWVLHAGLQDIELLLRELDQPEPPRLFDTQIAWGLLGPEASVSLAFLQFKLLGIRSSKGYQADDWLRRPLPPAQLAYAAEDIAHLPELEKVLSQRLAALGRRDVVLEVCRELLLPKAAAPTLLALESFRNAWQLDAGGRAALLALIDWHNALPESERSRTPPRTLLSIASRLPLSVNDLSRIKGVSAPLSRSHGATIVTLMKQASRATSDGLETLEPQAYATFDDYRAEARLALARVELSAELSIAPDLALPMALVRRMLPRVKATGSLEAGAEELSGWRAELIKPVFIEHARRLDAYPRFTPATLR